MNLTEASTKGVLLPVAGKFLALQLERLPPGEFQALADVSFSRGEDVARLPLAERWIVSSLHQVRARHS